MYRITSIFTISICCLFGLLSGQTLSPRALAGAEADLSVYGVLMGDYPHFSEGAMAQEKSNWAAQPVSPERAFALAYFDKAASMEVDSSQLSHSAYYQGIILLLQNKFAESVASFNLSENEASLPRQSKLPQFRIVAQYLDLYDSKSPIFAGFNGGFYNFSRDSIRWGFEEIDLKAYELMVEAVMEALVLSTDPAPYYEMLGDLLASHPEKAMANWFGSLAYLRLSNLKTDHKSAFEQKALFAMEAPRTSRHRFNTYQFIQFKKHVQSDLDIATQNRVSSLAKEKESGENYRKAYADEFGTQKEGVTWLREEERGAIPGIILEAVNRENEAKGKTLLFAKRADFKKVKQDPSYNLYAILIIALVFGAMIFLGMKLKKASKEV